MITTRQDKVKELIARKEARLSKFESGAYDKKYIKTYGEELSAYAVIYNLDADFGYELDYETRVPNWKYHRDVDKCHLLVEIDKAKRIRLAEAARLDKNEENRVNKKAVKVAAEAKAIASIPECLVKFSKMLKKQFSSSAIAQMKYYRAMPYPSYKDYSETARMIRYYYDIDEEHMLKSINESVDKMIINLVIRVNKKVGTVQSYDNLYVADANSYNEGVALNGYVIGEKGRAEVKSISAGGYNIQRLHIRTIVK